VTDEQRGTGNQTGFDRLEKISNRLDQMNAKLDLIIAVLEQRAGR
jgi:tetrahydromethanopterin S-methyltransferase subunit G